MTLSRTLLVAALGLSLAFVIAGLVYGSENKEQARDKAKSRFQK